MKLNFSVKKAGNVRYVLHLILCTSFFLFTAASEKKGELKISGFCKSLSAGTRILEEPGWTNWDMAPIYDSEGKVHLFVGRWKQGTTWHREAQIDHYIASNPEGPYSFHSTVFQNDSTTFFNPQINFVDGKYVMVFSFKEKETPSINQKIGIATSSSLYGPWKTSDLNPVIGPSFIPGSPNCLHASNPTFVKDKQGRYRIYYKSISDQPDDPYLRTISLAIADRIEGPYINHSSNPLITYVEHGVDVEDPYVFFYKGKYYLILEDRRGVADVLEGKKLNKEEIKDGGWRSGLIYQSGDGIQWGIPEIGYRSNSFYFDEPAARFERPHILWKDGKPVYLFLALDKGKYGLGTGAVLKVKGW